MLSLVLSLVCVLSCAQGVNAFPEAKSRTKTQILTTVIRDNSSESANIIGKMENGTEIKVLGTFGKYYRIDCYDMLGYIKVSQVTYTEDGKYIIRCREDSPDTGVLAYYDHVEAQTMRESILALAKEQLGEPYIYGGNGPYGFDCSGLTSYLYRNHGVTLQRRASLQLTDGVVVAKADMQVGDLVFFKEAGETYPVSHVGMYAGNNQIIHAGTNGIAYASLDSYWYGTYYLCARRIINTDQTKVARPSNTGGVGGAVVRPN